MVSMFHQGLPSRLALACICLLVMNFSKYKFASSSSQDSGDADRQAYKITDNVPQVRPWNRKLKEREISNVVYWLEKTSQVLLDVMNAIRNDSARFLQSNSEKSLFVGSIKCRLPQIEGSPLFIGKRIVEHFARNTERIITTSNPKELEDFAIRLPCFSRAIKNLVLKTNIKNAPNPREYEDFHKTLQMAEISVGKKHEELQNRRKYLETYINNIVRDNKNQSRNRRGLGTKQQQISSLSNLTLSDIQNLLAKDFSDLQSVIYQLVQLKIDLKNASNALSVVDILMVELGDLLNLVEASNSSNSSTDNIIINHGPYCKGLTIGGTLMQIFWGLLNDTVSHALVLEQEFNSTTVLQEAIDAVSCRAEAFSRVLQIIMRRMNTLDKTDITDALEDSLLQVGSVQNILQERVNGSKDALRDVEINKEEIKRRMARHVKEQEIRLYRRQGEEDGESKHTVRLQVQQLYNNNYAKGFD